MFKSKRNKKKTISDFIRLTLSDCEGTPRHINENLSDEFSLMVVDQYKSEGNPAVLYSHQFFRDSSEEDRWEDSLFDLHMSEVPAFSPSTFDFEHVFISAETRFYDAETPEGVRHWIELPIYQRTLQEKGLAYPSPLD